MQAQTNTKRALSQVIFRHTPGSLIALDDFNVYARVREIKGEPDTEVNKDLLFKSISRFADRWREDSNGRVKGFDPHLNASSFVAIRPKGFSPDAPSVFCDLFPPGFQCVKSDCGVYVDPRSDYFDGSCPRCKSSLRQIRYVWFHLCGLLYSLAPLKQIKCPQHGQKFLYLNDTGRFATSTWRCRECNSIDKGLGMIPCMECKTQLTPEELQKKQNFFRGSVWNDSWVYYSQTVSFVNLETSRSNDLLTSPEASSLIIDAITGRLEAGGTRLSNRANATIKCVSCGHDIPRTSKFCSFCGAKQESIGQDKNSHAELDTLNLSPDSSLVTFATLRDLERTQSAKDISTQASSTGNGSSISIVAAIPDIIKAGIEDVLLIQDFPLTTAAVGFSRLKSGPPAWLNSFPSTEATGTRVPIYTNCITSEAWMIKLSALHIIDWLKTNKRVSSEYLRGTENNSEAEATLWLVSCMSKETKSDEDRKLYDSVYPLLHSYAHLTLQLLGINSGLDAGSLGEMLLPEALSFIIYAGDSDIGGLSAAFSQSLSLFAADLADFARVCKFDPSCQNDDGGVCAGCLYTSRGCVDFNDNLSRSYLYGGKANEEDLSINIKTGYLDIH